MGVLDRRIIKGIRLKATFKGVNESEIQLPANGNIQSTLNAIASIRTHGKGVMIRDPTINTNAAPHSSPKFDPPSRIPLKAPFLRTVRAKVGNMTFSMNRCRTKGKVYPAINQPKRRLLKMIWAPRRMESK